MLQELRLPAGRKDFKHASERINRCGRGGAGAGVYCVRRRKLEIESLDGIDPPYSIDICFQLTSVAHYGEW